MKKILFTLLWLALLPASAAAQLSGGISGRVQDGRGTGLAGIVVMLAEKEGLALTQADGSFVLAHLPFGRYTLVARGLGYAAQAQTVVLQPAAPQAQVSFTLTESDQALQEVEVLGRKETTYKSQYSFIGTKTASRLLEVPQTISTVTKELIADQQAYTLNEVVKNVAGVNQYSSYDDLTVRGFRNGYESGFRLVNGLRSGYSYGNAFFRVPLTGNLERVEVLKGPGAALFGDINPGGTINLVTKKPLAESRRTLSLAAGSFYTLRPALDFSGPLNRAKTLLYRLNLGYESTRTFRQGNSQRSLMLAPSVSYMPGPKTTLLAELVYSRFRGYLDRGLPIRAGNLFALPLSFTLSQPDDHFRVQDLWLQTSFNHKIKENLSLNVAYMKFAYGEDLREHRTANSFADAPHNTLMHIRYFERQAREYTGNLAAYLAFAGHTGGIRHKVVAGADHVTFAPDKNSTMREARQQLVDGRAVPLTFDLENPVYESKDPASYLMLPTPAFFADYRQASYHTAGFYVQDQAALTRRLGLLLGLRYELFRDRRDYGQGQEQISQPAWLPRLGLTYALADSLNFFASYSRGFKPVAPQFIRFPERYGRSLPFRHETSYQAEAGLKAELLQGALLATLAVYQIEKRQALVNTGQTTAAGDPIYRQNGQTRSRGAELELTGNILPFLRLQASYAFNHTRVSQAALAAENGLAAANAPRHLAGWWARYDFGARRLNHLGVALGGNYLSRRRMEGQVRAVDTGALRWDYWPAYALANAAVFYELRPFKCSLHLNNVFDKAYFVGGYDYFRASPGAPRHLLAAISYTFP